MIDESTQWYNRMLKKHGSKEAIVKYMSEIGTKAGRAGTGHKFAHGKVSPVEAGKKSGVVRRAK